MPLAIVLICWLQDDEPAYVEQVVKLDGCHVIGSQPCKRAILKLVNQSSKGCVLPVAACADAETVGATFVPEPDSSLKCHCKEASLHTKSRRWRQVFLAPWAERHRWDI